MKKAYLEFVVGLFLAIGIGCLAWLSIKLARKEFFARDGYEVQAAFSNGSGLRAGHARRDRGRCKSAGSEVSGLRITKPGSGWSSSAAWCCRRTPSPRSRPRV